MDRLKIAERLSAQRPPGLPPLNVCLQVNVSGEDSKGGVAPLSYWRWLRPCELPRLVRGLMAIPAPAPEVATQRAASRSCARRYDALRGPGYMFDTLSMGMSADLEAAILKVLPSFGSGRQFLARG